MATGIGSSTKTTADLKLLEKLVTSLLETQGSATTGDGRTDGLHRSGSVLGRFRPMSRSFRSTGSLRRRNNDSTGASSGATGGQGGGVPGGEGTMPTIQESGTDRNSRRNSWNDRAGVNVRRVLNSIANAPHRFSQSLSGGGGGPLQDNDEERSNLTQNIL